MIKNTTHRWRLGRVRGGVGGLIRRAITTVAVMEDRRFKKVGTGHSDNGGLVDLFSILMIGGP